MAIEVLFLGSLQGYDSRTNAVADQLKTARPDVTVKVASPSETAALLAKWKLKFGPAVVIDGRVEFVGIPRLRTLVDRIDIVLDRRLHPPPPEPTPATAAAPSRPAQPSPTPPAAPPSA